MKVLIVHNFYQQSGGEDAVVINEMNLLKSHGHEVTLFSVHNDDIKTIAQKVSTALGTVYNFRTKKALQQVLRENRPDVMHVHNFFPLLSPSIFDASSAEHIPAVLTLHNFRILCPTGFLYHDGKIVERSLRKGPWWTLFQRTYRGSFLGTLITVLMIQFHRNNQTWERKVDKVVALTSFAKEIFSKYLIPERLLVVKGNAANAPEQSLISIEPRSARALYVGRLSEEKGLHVLMNAWKGLEYPIRVCGGGPMAEWMQSFENPNVHLCGKISSDQVQCEMLDAAFLVLPSVCYEMFPMTLAEAFGSGLPVIASRLGALADLVEDGVTGLLFTAGDYEDLRRAVKWAAAHPLEIRRMGINARLKYERSLTPEKNYSDLISIYEDVAFRRRANGCDCKR